MVQIAQSATVHLGELIEASDEVLTAVEPLSEAIRQRPVTGVHVSELADPGRYLDGGELLLTVGMALTEPDQAEPYVARLVAAGTAALGLGLGEGIEVVPEPLAHACRAHGLPLLSIAAGQPFLPITRSYWSLAAQRERLVGLRVADSQTRLARAAAEADPTPAVLDTLAHQLGGWVAWLALPTDPQHPDLLCLSERAARRRRSPELARLRGEADRWLARSGGATTSLLVDGVRVMAHPVPSSIKASPSNPGRTGPGQGRPAKVGPGTVGLGTVGPGTVGPGTVGPAGPGPVGVLMVGAERAQSAVDRRQIATTVALLSGLTRPWPGLDSRVGHRLGTAGVVALLVRGEVAAAGSLARLLGEYGAQEAVRLVNEPVLVMVSVPGAESAPNGTIGSLSGPTQRIDLLDPAAADPINSVPAQPGPHDRVGVTSRAGLTTPVLAAEVITAVGRARRLADRAEPGTVLVEPEGRGRVWAVRLAGAARLELTRTVTEHLRSGGRIEATARTLGIHRNTVRQRLAVAEDLIGSSLSDPDVIVELWPALIAAGPRGEPIVELGGVLVEPGWCSAGFGDRGCPVDR